MAEQTYGLMSHRYGKSRVRLMRVTRHDSYHDVDDWTVEVMLTGDFAEVFTAGDNTRIIATDTIKNTIYFLARQSKVESPEVFAQEIVDFLLSRNAQLSYAEVTIQTHLWKRLTIDQMPHPTTFMKGSSERQTTYVSRVKGEPFSIRSGFSGMTVLKTAHSRFTGFIRDNLTSLPETTDRLLGTELTAEWRFSLEALTQAIDFTNVRRHLREAMIAAFAKHDSLSVQQTLYAMAEAALQQTEVIDEVFLNMPNMHNLLVDLNRFGADNPNHIFVPTDEPHGTIEATVRRA